MFLGHINDLKDGEWKVLPHLKRWALHRNDGKYSLVSNVCPHQGSFFRDTEGKNTRLCPYHGWSFDNHGNPIGSGTTEYWCKNEHPLESQPVFIWNNFIFSEDPDIPEYDFLNTELLILGNFRVDVIKANYKSIFNIFLDIDHLPVVHPKVYDQLQTTNVEWFNRTRSNVQLALNNPEYESDYTRSMFIEDRERKYGAAWFALYPYTTVEYFPGAWINCVCLPVGENETAVSVYQYRDTRYSEDNWKLNLEIWEKAWEQDNEQALLIDPTFKPALLEEAKIHYRDWLDKNGY
jgi:phenylpropionate dioxygenase-like ring-hydroxylating dioxygenase large terminal subunit